MAHQDNVDGRTNLETLEAVLKWIAPQKLDKVRRHGNATLRPRILAAQAIVAFGWSIRRTLEMRVQEAATLLGRIFSQAGSASRQGLCKALQNTALLTAVQQHLRNDLAERKGHWTTLGKPTFAIDGTKVRAPRTKRNQATFAASEQSPAQRSSKSKSKSRSKAKSKARSKSSVKRPRYVKPADASKASAVQILVTVLWHLGTGLPFGWLYGGSESSERQQALELLRLLPERARLVMDAGFVGHAFWSTILDSGRSFVARVGANVALIKKLGLTKHGAKISRQAPMVHYWPDHARQADRPPLALRLVPLQTARSVVWIVTNELDLTDRQIQALYAARWGIEVFFRTVKQHFGHSRLLCGTPDNVGVELGWTLLGIWAMLFAAKCSLDARGLSLARSSPTQVLDAITSAITSLIHSGVHASLNLAACLKADESQRTTSKASRDYPRQKRHKPTGPPQLRLATDEERRMVKAFM